jgi:hypothetical protein
MFTKLQNLQELSRKSDECPQKGFLPIAERFIKRKENESNYLLNIVLVK